LKPELEYQMMRKVSYEEYREFLEKHEFVEIENTRIKLEKSWNIKKYQPENYTPEEWTVWSFPDRGDWATHIGNLQRKLEPLCSKKSHRQVHKGRRHCM